MSDSDNGTRMTDNEEPISAQEVIRSVYLARECRRRGDHEAARRWQTKAETWLKRHKASTRPPSPRSEAETGHD